MTDNGKLVTITPDPWSADATEDGSTTTWSAVDLGPYLAGEVVEEEPVVLRRTDESCLFYAERVNGIVGETESAKTWLVLEAARQELEAGHAVAYIDFEDTAARIVARLLALGADPEAIRERFRYVSPEEKISMPGWQALIPTVEGATLVVLDGVTEAMTREGLDLMSNSDVQQWYDRLPRPLTKLGAAVVTVDHVVKSKEGRGGYAIGAQHKKAAIGGAMHSLETVLPFGRGRDGLVRLKVQKDRPGFLRGLPDGGHAEVRVSSDGQNVALEVAPAPAKDAGGFRPTVLMERVSRTLEGADNGLSLRKLLDGVSGKKDAIRRAIDVLIEEDYVAVKPGPHGAHIHHSSMPYREADEE